MKPPTTAKLITTGSSNPSNATETTDNTGIAVAKSPIARAVETPFATLCFKNHLFDVYCFPGWGFTKELFFPLLSLIKKSQKKQPQTNNSPSLNSPLLITTKNKNEGTTYPEIRKKIAFAHSFGLHAITDNSFDAVIAFSSFYSYPEKTLLRAMQFQFQTVPIKVLKSFYSRTQLLDATNAVSTKEINQSLIDHSTLSKMQHSALKHSLQLMRTSFCKLQNTQTLLLHGTDDLIVPFKAQSHLKEELKNHTTLALQTSSHILPLTHPIECKDAILSFLEKIS